MSSTRSLSPPAPVTETLIVAHGSPSAPEPQERFVQALAERVRQETGMDVRGATLAKAGALDAAIDGFRAPIVFPHFMADGWFVSNYLQKRIASTGLANWHMVSPLGRLESLPGIAQRKLSAALRAHELEERETSLVIAAHGSPSDPRPARATERFADVLRGMSSFASIRVGYVDQAPQLSDALQINGAGILLPFFAARAGHVLIDLPKAVQAASFTGPVLAPIGTWDEIPPLIAHTLLAEPVVA